MRLTFRKWYRGLSDELRIKWNSTLYFEMEEINSIEFRDGTVIAIYEFEGYYLLVEDENDIDDKTIFTDLHEATEEYENRVANE